MSIEKPRKFSGSPRHKGGFSYKRKKFTDESDNDISGFEIPTEGIDKYVWDQILIAMQNPKSFIKKYIQNQSRDKTGKQKIEDEIIFLRSQITNIEAEIARVEYVYEKGDYSEEKMSEKISFKNKEIANLDKKIIKHEKSLREMGSIEVEVQKLKTASEQVRYRIENLTQAQKAILCNLFVDRVEMFRTEKPSNKTGKEWDIQAKVFFRFNPKNISDKIPQGRTDEDLETNESIQKNPHKGDNGVTGRT